MHAIQVLPNRLVGGPLKQTPGDLGRKDVRASKERFEATCTYVHVYFQPFDIFRSAGSEGGILL